ncbi:ferrous iron transport protein B [Ruminiclostridium sufflavum DSM 19573]|uniref:Ferrous iron transport protein B n=1 Tax=Ruminiclostridium sufflavum DSM 19573 TaxID=1121337 RepID=A0A318XK09_9FIRM|nr:ferrous iron transport protein B [Ruminiclostridium sufflavum DSM 19573]
MGLTNQTTGTGVPANKLSLERVYPDDKVIALAGNPNVGKSTVFNSLTGLNQHTGNWPGKTVANAYGKYRHKDKNFIMVDIPGTYSLMSNSSEEEIARDFVCFGAPDATVVVADATCLERNLNLILQTLEITDRVVVCINLIDEAERKKISIDCGKLSASLGVPVIATNARSNKGLAELMEAVYEVASRQISVSPLQIAYDSVIEEAIGIIQPKIKELAGDKINSRWAALKLIDGDESLLKALDRYLGYNLTDNLELRELVIKAGIHINEQGIKTDLLRDKVVSRLVETAEEISKNAIAYKNMTCNSTDRKIDRILTSKIFGIPIMLGMLAVIFWLTVAGANYPSRLLSDLFFSIEARLTDLFVQAGTPVWLHGILILGVYRTLAWVVSVMLPPMAIFFPLFTLLEDLGYLPRVAFNMDNFFKKACAHGKQALSMCMVKLIL